MNILLTCSGRRNYLVNYFKQALGDKGQVYAANSIADATSMVEADKAFIAPSLFSDEYIPFLLDICHSYEIKLLISLFDLELPILAKHIALFEDRGVKMAVSGSKVISICNDKLKTIEFGKDLKLKTLFTTTDIEETIKEINNGNIHFPIYIKPRWGMGSIAIKKAQNLEELTVLNSIVRREIENSYLKHYNLYEKERSVIFQEEAEGQEYGLDIVNDFNGNYITTLVKKKLAMRSGETDGAITENISELHHLGYQIAEHLGHIGNLDVDVFWNGSTSTILEMNARFGGGYPFSHLAGADIPKAYLQWAQEEKASSKNFKIKFGVKGLKGIKMLRSKF